MMDVVLIILYIMSNCEFAFIIFKGLGEHEFVIFRGTFAAHIVCYWCRSITIFKH